MQLDNRQTFRRFLGEVSIQLRANPKIDQAATAKRVRSKITGLDTVRHGWGTKWGSYFEAIGCDMAEDVADMDDEMFRCDKKNVLPATERTQGAP